MVSSLRRAPTGIGLRSHSVERARRVGIDRHRRVERDVAEHLMHEGRRGEDDLQRLTVAPSWGSPA
jgi:hypothetical protein